MNSLTRGPLALVLLGLLSGCAPSGERGGAPPGPSASAAPVASEWLTGRSLREPATAPPPRALPVSTEGALMSRADPAPSAPAPHAEDADDRKACPPEMVVVHGNYCTDARQDCVEWMDQDNPGSPKQRCKRFAEPSRCAGEQRHMRFCIDRYEYAKAAGELPVGDVSWTLAREACESQKKRLCGESEWTFACEGEEMRPYPTGFVRDKAACNFDREDLVDHGKLMDHRQAVDANPRCVSPFGAVDMVGNVDEWVVVDHGYPPQRSGLKGGWWLAGRNRCRPMTAGHDEYFHELQTGYRCCKEAASEGTASR